ncbi:hypothetical protein HDU67_003638 [Dinochytrium kinnereticum]|nr:hypothetical protein HDU67_003638 [Dinochytrium kinnereticum]
MSSRKVYTCRRCGEPKKGHHCSNPESDEMIGAAAAIVASVTASAAVMAAMVGVVAAESSICSSSSTSHPQRWLTTCCVNALDFGFTFICIEYLHPSIVTASTSWPIVPIADCPNCRSLWIREVASHHFIAKAQTSLAIHTCTIACCSTGFPTDSRSIRVEIIHKCIAAVSGCSTGPINRCYRCQPFWTQVKGGNHSVVSTATQSTAIHDLRPIRHPRSKSHTSICLSVSHTNNHPT